MRWTFRNATVTFLQANFGVSEAIDNSLSLRGNGWVTLGRAETLVWETSQNVGDGGVDSYKFWLKKIRGLFHFSL